MREGLLRAGPGFHCKIMTLGCLLALTWLAVASSVGWRCRGSSRQEDSGMSLALGRGQSSSVGAGGGSSGAGSGGGEAGVTFPRRRYLSGCAGSVEEPAQAVSPMGGAGSAEEPAQAEPPYGGGMGEGWRSRAGGTDRSPPLADQPPGAARGAELRTPYVCGPCPP